MAQAYAEDMPHGPLEDRVSPPHPLWTFTEIQRALLEASSLFTVGLLLRRLPRGDGHPVMVLPGFMATDQSTTLLRRHLDRLGYHSYPWEFGRNLGPRGDLEARMVDRARQIAAAHGRPLSIVGQSLGGIYAREIARDAPDIVRQVITLGSPFGTLESGGTSPGVARLFEMSTGRTTDQLRAERSFEDMREPPPVPVTAIYSKSDGVVSWEVCIERDHPHTDNIEIVGSHCGMAFNPVVIALVADRLAQAEGCWERFDRGGLKRYLFSAPRFSS